MDYESFKEKFVEDVKDRLYEQGAEVDLSIHTVNKKEIYNLEGIEIEVEMFEKGDTDAERRRIAIT